MRRRAEERSEVFRRASALARDALNQLYTTLPRCRRVVYVPPELAELAGLSTTGQSAAGLAPSRATGGDERNGTRPVNAVLCGTPLFELAREKGAATVAEPRYRAVLAQRAFALTLVRGELDETA